MIFVRYAAFAIFSIAVNLLFQFLSDCSFASMPANWQAWSLFSTLNFYTSMMVGTMAGLVVKYVLDKKFIFYHEPLDKADDAKKFLIYSFMGVFTTIIFWGTEILFHYLHDSEISKYIGGAIGLAIGYTIKYQLDKKFVFVHKDEPEIAE